MNKLPMTAAGHSALEGELKQRIRVERPRLVQRIQEAIADDTNLAENSEYQAAKTEQEIGPYCGARRQARTCRSHRRVEAVRRYRQVRGYRHVD